jgi:membrane-bound lytic murein transglycosylase D
MIRFLLVLGLLAGPGLTAASAADLGEPDAALTKQLKAAEDFYAQGLGHFKAGKIEEGRADLKKSFDIVIANLDEDSLPASMHLEFTSMLDKLRGWPAPEEKDDNVSELDVSDAALKTTTAAAHGAAHGVMAAIKIDAENPITKKFIEIYTQQRPKTVEEALARSGRYHDMIASALKEKGLPPELFYLVMAESEYKHDALSHSGAAGLWQFMPESARKYGLTVSYWVDERYSPEKATKAAVRYLADLYQWFGDWNLAIAAYNRGEGGLGRDMQYSHSLDFGSLAGRNALPEETHHYVPKFNACVLIGQHPEKYGLHPQYEAPDEYDLLALPRPLDLGIAAKSAGVAEAVIHRLNPQIRTWCTPQSDPNFELRIPKGSKEAALAALAKVQDWNPGPSMMRYVVRVGDFLGRIAKKNHTTVKSILETNKLRSPKLLRPGMVLLIRPGREGHEARASRHPHKKGKHRLT